jgi:hypothetical protein
MRHMSVLLFLTILGWVHCSGDFASFLRSLDPTSSVPFNNDESFASVNCFSTWHERDKQPIQKFVSSLLKPVGGLLMKPDCHLRKPKVVLSGSPELLPSWFSHFPHFADFYFRAYSILLWQRILYPQLHQDCIEHILIPSSTSGGKFWFNLQDHLEKESWDRKLISTVNKIFKRPVLITENAPYPKVTKSNKNVSIIEIQKYGYYNHTFLHPSDGILLAAAVLGHHPCEASRQLKEQRRQHHRHERLNITIVNRRKGRGLWNVEEFEEKIANLSLGKPLVHSFESMSFEHQAQTMYSSDVVISIHGAAMTNMAFMKPCSVVIEILPWLFHGHGFFHRFANSSDILHYEWMETPENCFRHPPPEDREEGEAEEEDDDECDLIMKDFMTQYSKHETYRLLDEKGDYYSEDGLSQKCAHNETKDNPVNCAVCAREIYGINASVVQLEKFLLLGIKDREKCLKTHPYYV